MFKRRIDNELTNWAENPERKPLILRGARQVGKTTVIRQFAKKFDQYIELNLDKESNIKLFEEKRSLDDLISAIFFFSNKSQDKKKTLIFIDEIQNSPNAVKQLRYFYEDRPDLYVIAAGSLLESLMNKTFSFPVGRVEYLYMYPFSFVEFMKAYNPDLEDVYNQIPIPEYAHDKFLDIFSEFALVGGMPEVVVNYLKYKDITKINSIYKSLITGYKDDIEKYASTDKEIQLIRFIIENVFFEAGKRIKFVGFGNSNYKSDDIKQAMLTVEKALIISVVYPTTKVTLPIEPNFRKSPKITFLDTGVINYFANYQKKLFGVNDIMNVHDGIIAENIVAQELRVNNDNYLIKIHFWIREKNQSNAEVDFVIQHEDLLIPVEVKSGKSGRLRSLHQFIDRCPHNFAVRVYSGKLEIQRTKTIAGKEFYLLNLPLFLVSKMEEYVKWFLDNYKNISDENKK